MLNEDKVKLMTRLAIYEAHDGKKAMKMTHYFRGDYVSWNVIKTVLAVTAAYLCIVGLWLMYHFEYLMVNLYTMDLMELLKKVLTNYAGLLLVYFVLSYAIYNLKYSKAMKSLKRFRLTMKKVRQLDGNEAKGRENEI